MSQHRRFPNPRAGRWPALVLATLGLLTGPAAHAAGFGQLRLQSHLGQPLQAEIDIAGVAPAEASGIAVQLASPDDYAKAGLTYPAALAGAQWQLERHGNGAYVARLRSAEPLAEPFVDLLVELSWPGGKASRTYTVLLDPDNRDASTPATATAPGSPPMIVQPEGVAESQSSPLPGGRAATGAEGRAAAPRDDDRRAYTVQPGDHLYGIAETLVSASDGVSLDQMVVALFRANPRAFIAGNMNRLKAGAVLKLPGAPQAGTISPGEARRELVAHTRAFDAYRNRLADAAAAAVAERGDGRQQAGRITARVDDAGAPETGPRDELTLSKPDRTATQRPGTSADASAEADVARERQLRDAEERLAQLRKNVDDIERLLELKSAEMARQSGQGASAAPGIAGTGAAGSAADITASAAQAPGAPAPTSDWLSGPFVLPAGGALIALLAGYGLYRRQRGQQALREPGQQAGSAPANAMPEGPLALGGFTLPLDAFPAADGAFTAARHDDEGDEGDKGHDAGARGVQADDDDGIEGNRQPPSAATAVTRRPPAFDFGGISLDLDPSDVTPARDDGVPPPRKGDAAGERA